MEIKQISETQLRTMSDKEGLILQGCGGDLKEWVDGINDLLTQNKILLEGTKFEYAYTFNYGVVNCLLFPFDDVKIDMGKLSIWRIQTHQMFLGTWLSDFVPNRLGGFIDQSAGVFYGREENTDGLSDKTSSTQIEEKREKKSDKKIHQKQRQEER